MIFWIKKILYKLLFKSEVLNKENNNTSYKNITFAISKAKLSIEIDPFV